MNTAIATTHIHHRDNKQPIKLFGRGPTHLALHLQVEANTWQGLQEAASVLESRFGHNEVRCHEEATLKTGMEIRFQPRTMESFMEEGFLDKVTDCFESRLESIVFPRSSCLNHIYAIGHNGIDRTDQTIVTPFVELYGNVIDVALRATQARIDGCTGCNDWTKHCH